MAAPVLIQLILMIISLEFGNVASYHDYGQEHSVPFQIHLCNKWPLKLLKLFQHAHVHVVHGSTARVEGVNQVHHFLLEFLALTTSQSWTATVSHTTSYNTLYWEVHIQLHEK